MYLKMFKALEKTFAFTKGTEINASLKACQWQVENNAFSTLQW